jgi:hypothetical protein
VTIWMSCVSTAFGVLSLAASAADFSLTSSSVIQPAVGR